eukprot:g16193.t1
MLSVHHLGTVACLARPPRCKFVPPLLHPSVYPSDLRILNEDRDWGPNMTIKHMLNRIFDMPDSRNIDNPA